MNAHRRKSKKRSGVKRPDGPPLVFFVDACLGRHDVADALTAAGALVELHHTHFLAGTPDPEWLPAIGVRGWIILTKDRHIRKRPLELDAILASGARAFVLTAADLKGPEQAALLAGALPRIRRLCRQPARFVATITRTGIVNILTRR
jgi:hypothetical protein